MVFMLVMVALVVDIGKAYLVQRQLQAGVDAAALAGAQHLPVASEASQVAQDYGPSAGKRNEVTLGSDVQTTVTMRCVQSAPGCAPASGNFNAVNVKASSKVEMLFARVLGIDSLTVRAQATACSPCSAKPLDIVIALDRTGSMCQFGPGQPDPSCTDLNNAKQGIDTFLQFMDPTLDSVGLVLWPPVIDRSFVARCPYTPWDGNSNPNRPPNFLNGRHYAYDAWWPEWDLTGSRGQTPSIYAVASLSNDYLVQDTRTGAWVPNPQSALYQRLGCANGNGTTHYASALEEAQREMDRNGRGTVQDVIIFLSDGAANTSNVNMPASHWRNNSTWIRRPCGSGVETARLIKNAPRQPAPTVIYTIGYDLDAGGGAPERCRAANATTGHATSSNETCGSWGCTAFDAIRAIATDPDGAGPQPPNFYNKPNPGELNTIFTRIAADLQRPAARLIDDNTP